MFVRMIPDNKGKRSGYYCSLVESNAIYLKAALSEKDPESVVKTELAKQKQTSIE